MSNKKTDKKAVTIYVVQTAEDEEDEDIIQEEGDEDSDDDGVIIQRDYPTRSKAKIPQKPTPKVEKVPVSKRFRINRGQPITDLKSLISAFDHPNADIKQKELVESLKDLDSMIGMNKLKEQIINQILFFVQDMHDPETYLHTVLTGEPGCGKTRAINILAKIYCKLGVLESDKVVKADRASLIGKWCGHTAIKTQQVLESAKGGVLILDEVYSLGSKDHADSFAKECIDTLNQYLSEHVNEFVCVIAGYEQLVKECFFDQNPGLERRFPWKFSMERYTPDELAQIFKTQVNDAGWKLEAGITDKYIGDLLKLNKECFKGNGGDTKNLFDRCKMINARRVFTENAMTIEEEAPVKKKRKGRKFSTPVVADNVKILSKSDLDKGMKFFSDHKKESKNALPDYAAPMYS